MKNKSTKMTKAIVGLMMSLGSQAFAKNAVVTAETLLKNNLEAQTIQELLAEKILLKTNIRGLNIYSWLYCNTENYYLDDFF